MLNKMTGVDPKLLKKAYDVAKKRKAVMEYKGTKAEEKYASKAAMKKHESKESKKTEAREEYMSRFKKK